MLDFLAIPRRPIHSNITGEMVTVGYTRRLGPLSQFIITRSGHMCTLEQPDVTRTMFIDFVSGVV
jgi:hypothetical protein